MREGSLYDYNVGKKAMTGNIERALENQVVRFLFSLALVAWLKREKGSISTLKELIRMWIVK